MGFIIHFYIIFGTNLLTGGPAQIAVFLPLSEFPRKRISDGVQTEWNLWERDFWNEQDPGDLDPMSSNQQGIHEVGGAPTPRARPPPSWPPRGFLDGGSKSPGSYLMRKSRSRRFHSVWTPFDILFLRNSEIGKKQQFWAGPPVNRLVPKNNIKVENKSQYSPKQ